ncbi:hypothetical protein K432DRAFT_250219, partial [Lepidopterella palustris CBS 459.81]
LNPNLQEIRILSILPRSKSTEIECSLERVSLVESLNYKTLSYTWGDPRNTCMIKLDHCPFSVTKNLSVALQHIRKEHKVVKIWIDAIC